MLFRSFYCGKMYVSCIWWVLRVSCTCNTCIAVLFIQFIYLNKIASSFKAFVLSMTEHRSLFEWNLFQLNYLGLHNEITWNCEWINKEKCEGRLKLLPNQKSDVIYRKRCTQCVLHLPILVFTDQVLKKAFFMLIFSDFKDQFRTST